jgi:hypothetical protein
MSNDPWIWAGALCTIAIFSYLWRENPLYRLAEHIFVGISVGYGICITWFNVLHPKLWNPLIHEQEFWLLVPASMAIMMLFRFSSKHGWISFWPLAFLIGFSGYAIPATIDSYMLKQLQASINVPMTGGIGSILNSIVILGGTLSCLIYFYFSFPHKGVVGRIAKFGSLLLMVSFGAAFGYTVMARISLLIGRMLFLLRDWLGVVS